MMQREKVLIVLLIIFCTFTDLSGCSNEKPPTLPKIEVAPAGFALIKDVEALPKGTKLYESNGELFGSVLDHDPNYTLPNGKKEKGTKIDFAANGAPFWLPDTVITATKCVKQ